MFVYVTCVLEGEANAKLSLDNIWKLFQEDLLPNNASNFFRQVINCMRVWNYLGKTLGLPLNTETIKQTHGIMMEDEKDFLEGKYRRSPVFLSYHSFAPASYIERYMKDTIFKSHETVFHEKVSLILAHVLMQVKCCLFPVILRSLHRRGRRHYIHKGSEDV